MRPPTTTTSAACSAILLHCCLLRARNCSIFGIGRQRERQPAELTNGQPVLQPALSPQRVQTARNFQRRALADIAFEDFTVIADGLDDPVSPIVGQPERLSELAFDAEQTA